MENGGPLPCISEDRLNPEARLGATKCRVRSDGMRTLAMLFVLLLAAPAWANSIEDAFCRPPSTPVARREGAEKFCRSFARALHKLPQSAADEARALLSPESLVLMTAMTAAWVGANAGQAAQGC